MRALCVPDISFGLVLSCLSQFFSAHYWCTADPHHARWRLSYRLAASPRLHGRRHISGSSEVRLTHASLGSYTALLVLMNFILRGRWWPGTLSQLLALLLPAPNFTTLITGRWGLLCTFSTWPKWNNHIYWILPGIWQSLGSSSRDLPSTMLTKTNIF